MTTNSGDVVRAVAEAGRDDIARVVVTREVVLETVNPRLVPRDAPTRKRARPRKSA